MSYDTVKETPISITIKLDSLGGGGTKGAPYPPPSGGATLVPPPPMDERGNIYVMSMIGGETHIHKTNPQGIVVSKYHFPHVCEYIISNTHPTIAYIDEEGTIYYKELTDDTNQSHRIDIDDIYIKFLLIDVNNIYTISLNDHTLTMNFLERSSQEPNVLEGFNH
jgi:hypothetical protein